MREVRKKWKRIKRVKGGYRKLHGRRDGRRKRRHLTLLTTFPRAISTRPEGNRLASVGVMQRPRELAAHTKWLRDYDFSGTVVYPERNYV